MKSLATILFAYLSQWLLLSLFVLGFGCSDEASPVPYPHGQRASPHLADELAGYVLRLVSGDSLLTSLPHCAGVLYQTAPAEEDDSAYWQWYSRTLAVPDAITQYHREKDSTVFLSWDFNKTDRLSTSGRLAFWIREEGPTLTITLRAEALQVQQRYLTGTYHSVWRVYRTRDAPVQYELLNERDKISTTR